jgi:Tol biopolymer transport system component
MKKLLIAILVCALFIAGCSEKITETTGPVQEDQVQEGAQTETTAISPGKILHNGLHTDQDRGLWIINTDGTGLYKVVNKYVDGKWSPRGDKISYKMSKSIFIMNPDTSQKKEIARTDEALGEYYWTPDSRYIVFEEGSGIRAVDMNTYSETVLTGDSSDQMQKGSSPAYPEKDRIAYIFEDKIYKVNTDGTNTEIWLDLKNPQALKASPDGIYLSFSDDGAFWIAKDEKNTEDMTKVADGVVVNYEWSPDSKKIVFEIAGEKFYIYNLQSKTSVTVQKNSEDRFSWSPDSQWIAFTFKSPDTYEDVWVVKADGTGLQKLIACPTACEKPDWGP